MTLLDFESIAAWRDWLEQNHGTAGEVWLVYYKKGCGRPGLDYLETVDEALCFGWIDSQIRRVDEQRYARKFTPRKAASKWSTDNRRRAEELIQAGRMTPAGLAAFEAARGRE